MVDRLIRTTGIAVVAASLGACGGGDAASVPRSAAPAVGTPTPASSASVSTDALRALIDAVNASDVTMARLALQRSVSPPVRAFASSLASAHRQRVTDLSPLVPPAARDLVDPLRDLEQRTLRGLVALPRGPAFEAAYLASQVESHRTALAILDAVQVPDSPPDRIALLRDARADVRGHLQRAEVLRREHDARVAGR